MVATAEEHHQGQEKLFRTAMDYPPPDPGAPLPGGGRPPLGSRWRPGSTTASSSLPRVFLESCPAGGTTAAPVPSEPDAIELLRRLREPACAPGGADRL